MTIWVCTKCGVKTEDSVAYGWLIGTSKFLQRQKNGEMVIRCPHCIDIRAIATVKGGRMAIRV